MLQRMAWDHSSCGPGMHMMDTHGGNGANFLASVQQFVPQPRVACRISQHLGVKVRDALCTCSLSWDCDKAFAHSSGEFLKAFTTRLAPLVLCCAAWSSPNTTSVVLVQELCGVTATTGVVPEAEWSCSASKFTSDPWLLCVVPWLLCSSTTA